MKTILPIALLILVAAFRCSAQGETVIDGIIKDSSDNAPISSASVAIGGSATGTLSDADGSFRLTLTTEQRNGVLTISCMGYLPRKVKVADIKSSGSVFLLQRTAYAMKEIAISPSQKKEITAKMIEEMMAKLSDTFYISKYETSRYLYLAFLQDICAHDDTTCVEAGFHITQTTYHGQYGYQHQVSEFYVSGLAESLPVCDITYEGAKQFCLWLTKKYSQFKNRKFKNAVFRLPTSAEWTYSAQGGSKVKSRFPWPGDSPYCYRPNDTLRCYYVLFDDSTASKNLAGAYWSVYSGHKNKFGLTNICGNAAEMVQEKGVYKGGSSMDKLENIGIYAPQEPNRKDPDYFIGFRFAMVKN